MPILLGLLVIAIGVAAFILAVWMVVWNVNDISSVGVNFWNIFWLGLVAVGLFGGVGASTK